MEMGSRAVDAGGGYDSGYGKLGIAPRPPRRGAACRMALGDSNVCHGTYCTEES